MDMFDKPDWVKELLEIIVDKAISWIDAVAALNGGKAAFCSDFNDNVIHVGDDGTAQMPPAQMEEFMRAPHVRLANHIRSRGWKVQAHNCGRADHLLRFSKDTVRIDRYVGFSYLTDKKALKEIMGGSVFLMGGIDTVKLHDGKPEDVLEDCRVNIAPGTTVQNLNAMSEAAAKFGAF